MSRLRTLLIQPRDPLIARDARPFSAAAPGGRATTLPWPLPQTVAGALRTHIGDALGFDWARKLSTDTARSWALKGPLLAVRRPPPPGEDAEGAWVPYFPAPRDAFVYEEGRKVFALQPLMGKLSQGAGCNLPRFDLPADAPGLRPIAMNPDEDMKPDEGGATWWSLAGALGWLAAALPTAIPGEVDRHHDLPKDTRVHVGIDEERQAHRDGLLFATQGLAFARAPHRERPRDGGGPRAVAETAILCRLAAHDDWQPTAAYLPLGGERRLADLRMDDPPEWPGPEHSAVKTFLDHLAATLDGMKEQRLRLQLATPTIFERGWLPDGTDPATLTVTLPDWPNGPALRLVGAVVGRPQAVSGWALSHQPSEHKQGQRRAGPKATRLAVPAGCVYFFEVTGDTRLERRHLETLWLRSICGRHQDRLDGYGLVLPGCWAGRGEPTPATA